MTGGDTQGGPNTVLRVIIEHMVYPVTLDVLQQVRETTRGKRWSSGAGGTSGCYEVDLRVKEE